MAPGRAERLRGMQGPAPGNPAVVQREVLHVASNEGTGKWLTGRGMARFPKCEDSPRPGRAPPARA
ncbi:hypothetical protein BDE18_2795 [Paracoccus pantotrophus]|uniref:Uncharacterized protein n=1 Tax=Paracoccus pantotrophus TaxID=82367 RepID=A0ABX9S7W8_PARPN|nr:hypothetical protein BDE18_2795 [Paracoccus pantotrophus]